MVVYSVVGVVGWGCGGGGAVWGAASGRLLLAHRHSGRPHPGGGCSRGRVRAAVRRGGACGGCWDVWRLCDSRDALVVVERV